MCTGIRLAAGDGSQVWGRTLEFGANLLTFDLIAVPRNTAYTGTAPGGLPGLPWTTRYGFVGFNPFGMPHVADGVNEQGLGAGAFYFTGFAGYQPVSSDDAPRALAPWEFITWLLGTQATIEEVRQAMDEIRVGGTTFATWGITPPLHYWVHDASGDSIVIEFIQGQPVITSNPVGVLTNAPSFDWHLTNLRNYLGLQPNNLTSATVGVLPLQPLSQGTGMLGLPGDFTSPSRFVRATALLATTEPVANAGQAVSRIFRILNQFDIPPGAVRATENGTTIVEVTQWTSAADLTNPAYYFHTIEDRRIRKIDLKALDFRGTAIRTIGSHTAEDVEDVTALLA